MPGPHGPAAPPAPPAACESGALLAAATRPRYDRRGGACRTVAARPRCVAPKRASLSPAPAPPPHVSSPASGVPLAPARAPGTSACAGSAPCCPGVKARMWTTPSAAQPARLARDSAPTGRAIDTWRKLPEQRVMPAEHIAWSLNLAHFVSRPKSRVPRLSQTTAPARRDACRHLASDGGWQPRLQPDRHLPGPKDERAPGRHLVRPRTAMADRAG